MSYDIHLTIPEDSSGGYLIASLTAQQHITPSEAVERIISQAAQQAPKPSLAPNGPETPAELVARLQAHKKARGASEPRPPKSALDPEPFFGMMAGVEAFSRTMDQIIASRAKRYGSDE